jgi:hypothetical protein
MCVNALVRCGIPTSDPAIVLGTKYLLSMKDQWILPGQEIDGAFAMESVLAVGTRWRDISSELSRLLAWIADREPWATPVQIASDSHDESCKVAQIASSMLGIVWDTVKSELPLLLEGLSTTVYDVDDEACDARDLARMISDLIGDLKSRIQQEVSARQDIGSRLPSVASGEVSDQLRVWLGRRQSLNGIEAEFGRLVSRGVMRQRDESHQKLIHSLDHLGRECFGAAWEVTASGLSEIGGTSEK